MKLLNTEFAWYQNSLSEADRVIGVYPLMEKGMVRVLINKKGNQHINRPDKLGHSKIYFSTVRA